MNSFCLYCGNALPKPSHGVQKYCGPDCKRLAKNQRVREKRKRNYVIKRCLACGKEFEAKRASYVFCSIKCKHAYHTLQNSRGYTTFTCAICGKEFFSGGKGPRLYCGDECRKKARAIYYDSYYRRLQKCHTPGCSHKTRNYYCSICNRIKRTKD